MRRFTKEKTKHKCPDCGNSLIQPAGYQPMDATKLYCERCKKDFYQDWRTGKIG